MKRRERRHSARRLLLLVILLGLTLAIPTTAQAVDASISAPGAVPDEIRLAGSWAAWDDYSVDPAVIRWRNLDTGESGTIEAPGLQGSKGIRWDVGEGYLVRQAWVGSGEEWEQQLVLCDLQTGAEQVLMSNSGAEVGFCTDGALVYWLSEGTLHRVGASGGDAKSWEIAADSRTFDVQGDWFVRMAFDEEVGYGAGGHVLARNLVSGQELTLGSVTNANLSGTAPGPSLSVDGPWVVWTSDKSFDEADWRDTCAFAYNLDERTLLPLEEAMGPAADPMDIAVADGVVAWTSPYGSGVRTYLLPLAAPEADLAQPVSKTPGWQYLGGIDENRIVWRDNRNGSAFAVYARGIDEAPAEAFSDIADSPYGSAIEWSAASNIASGFGDGTFGADGSVLRAQFAKMAVLSLGLEVTEGATPLPFTDVERPANDLYPDDYVAVAAAYGITQGTSASTFSPWDAISRAQVVTMVTRALEALHPGLLLAPYPGFVSSWGEFSPTHAPSALVAQYNGLLGGLVSPTVDPLAPNWWQAQWSAGWSSLQELDPWAPMPRGEVAQVLANAHSLIHARAARWYDDLLPEMEEGWLGATVFLPAQLPAAFGLCKPPIAHNEGNEDYFTFANPQFHEWAGAPGYDIYLRAFGRYPDATIRVERASLSDWHTDFTEPTGLYFQGREWVRMTTQMGPMLSVYADPAPGEEVGYVISILINGNDAPRDAFHTYLARTMTSLAGGAVSPT